eukprot:NODE_786_length_1349_cov_60.336154_g574_i0.p2 GENE.NODE_786_length_1349_cov_60.336154_g574_i0~~NODE_786_length_1349_cov_60.336154_g574_i0.p2  ORF type:complete len:145 (+),score=63.11 NODE_786_length_1349_cov_60.336154_g574_i0:52-435(+)
MAGEEDISMLDDILKGDDFEEKHQEELVDIKDDDDINNIPVPSIAAKANDREPSPKLLPEESIPCIPSSTIPPPQTKQRTRYFISKSYSAENVSISYKRGIWATQKQNEQLFNDAFLVWHFTDCGIT